MEKEKLGDGKKEDLVGESSLHFAISCFFFLAISACGPPESPNVPCISCSTILNDKYVV